MSAYGAWAMFFSEAGALQLPLWKISQHTQGLWPMRTCPWWFWLIWDCPKIGNPQIAWSIIIVFIKIAIT
jgi:hypothetical protein